MYFNLTRIKHAMLLQSLSFSDFATFFLLYCFYNTVCSVYASIHLSEEALRHGALDSFSFLLYKFVIEFLKFGIRGPKHPTEKPYHGICGSPTLDYISTSAVFMMQAIHVCGSLAANIHALLEIWY